MKTITQLLSILILHTTIVRAEIVHTKALDGEPRARRSATAWDSKASLFRISASADSKGQTMCDDSDPDRTQRISLMINWLEGHRWARYVFYSAEKDTEYMVFTCGAKSIDESYISPEMKAPPYMDSFMQRGKLNAGARPLEKSFLPAERVSGIISGIVREHRKKRRCQNHADGSWAGDLMYSEEFHATVWDVRPPCVHNGALTVVIDATNGKILKDKIDTWTD